MIGPMLVVAAHVLDALATRIAIDIFGFWGESNPIAHVIAGVTGLEGLVALKVLGGVAAGGVVLWLRRGSHSWNRVHADAPLLVAAGLGIIGAGTGLASIIVVGS